MEPKWTLVFLGLVQFGLSVQSCPPGFIKSGTNCTDEDECEDKGLCGNYSICHNTFGSYYCTCEEGYESRTTTNFTSGTGQCKDLNECLRGEACSNVSNSKCVNTLGSYKCVCLPGFQKEENNTCSDINECLRNSSVCGSIGSCNNTPGSYTCICPQGYQNQGNQSAPCIDTDECDSKELICGEYGSCMNSPGSYSCKCETGYTNYGNNQSKCTELKCDTVNTTPTQAGVGKLLSLFVSSCESLRNHTAPQLSGESLLQDLMKVSGEVVSSGNINDSSTLSVFLGAMEDTLHLIGPQLNESVTRVENSISETCLEVKKNVTPPTGRVTLNTNDVHLNISWKTVVGEQYPGFAYVGLVSHKALNSTNTSVVEEPNAGSRTVEYYLNSPVVTVCVSNKKTELLPEPITLTFKHQQVLQEGAVSEQRNYSCVFWAPEDGGTWSRNGCVGAVFNATHAMCSWNHLSSFAVLMALYPIEDNFELVLITRIGLSLSLLCLFLCILTFSLCRAIKSTRTTIHLQLCVCLFIANFLFLFFISSTKNEIGCSFVAGLLHFFFLSAFCWMLLEGVQLYLMVVLVFHTTIRLLYMCAVGYGIPLIIVIISAMANPSGYGTTRHCWLSLENGFIWSFFAPVCLIVVLNSFFFIITVWKLAAKFSSLNPDLSKLKKLKGFLVTAVAQLCVLGGMWVFGCFMFQGNVVILYIFTLLNSLQGALIFIMHCLMRKSVREEYSKLCGGVCRPPKKRYSEFSTNQSSNSQRPLRSAPSTGESQI
ncbi:adhesion G protein-coupled receptor E5-like isoform X2 [Hoplias malabaricus]|uniref:adhesion G protein-coupled receptor E5-like isoform X2 n=1 Tax=Hoplias malabaricus TaxID=27720 RepID=UPI0034620CFF